MSFFDIFRCYKKVNARFFFFTGINGKLKYSIQSLDQEDNDFTIDPDNGTIWPHRSLDRETTASYNLVVVAKDGGRPAASELSSTVQV